MSQPVLTATLALAIAVVLTTATAIAASSAATSGRAMNLIVSFAVIAFAAGAFERTELRINFTASMPIGIYLLSPLPRGGVKRGMLVAACAPGRAAKVGRLRGYLASGLCTDGTELLLKSVAAIVGDEIDITSAGVWVDGCLLAGSRPVARDRSGRSLRPWQSGRFELAEDQVWLYADDDRSWDSRYWGAISRVDVKAMVVPLLARRAPLMNGDCRRSRRL